MLPESMKFKKSKDYTNPGPRYSMDVNSHYIQEKFDVYSPKYDQKQSQNSRYKQKKVYNDFQLNINSKSFTINNYEDMDKKTFTSKLLDFLNKLKLNEETYLITKIKIYSELSKHKSRHFDAKEYDELLGKLGDVIDDQ